MDPLIVLFGLGVGLLVGATGMGGGSLMTPLLILVFGVKPVVAVGTDLSYAAVTKTVGGWRHWRSGTVDGRLAFWLAVGSCPAALVGVYVLNLLRDAYGDGFDDFLIISISRCSRSRRDRSASDIARSSISRPTSRSALEISTISRSSNPSP